MDQFIRLYMKHHLIYTTLGILLSTGMWAQRGYEVGIGAGVSYYFGDLNPRLNLKTPRPTLYVLGRRNFDERLSARAGLGYARVGADDADGNTNFQRIRNLSFFSDILEAHVAFEFNFFEYVHGSRDKSFTPYILGGLTGYTMNPKAELDGETYELREFGTEGQALGDEYGRFHIGLIYGMGVKWDLSYYWSMNLEVSSRVLFTDYLDDVSQSYPDPNELASLRGDIAVRLSDRSPEDIETILGEPGIQRGDSKDNDSFAMATIGLAYYFGRVSCPPISRPQ